MRYLLEQHIDVVEWGVIQRLLLGTSIDAACDIKLGDIAGGEDEVAAEAE